MPTRIALGGIEAEVVFKDIRNVHLTVLPPNGRVRISAPAHMALDTVRVFALSKLAWIKSQRESMGEQEREPSREYLERESHYVWGAALSAETCGDRRRANGVAPTSHSGVSNKERCRPGG